MSEVRPWGYGWRSSQSFVIFTATLGLFSETFLYAFIVPILSYMIEDRLELPPSQTQWLTTALLATHGFVSVVSAPIIGHFADKTSSRRIPLLIALAGCFVGTLLLSICPSVWVLFVGRIVQAASGSAGWIVAFATLTDNVKPDHIGKVLGTAMSFVIAGIITGPMVSGALLQLVGYWAAWSAPLLLLAVGFIARLLMLEKNDMQVATSEHASIDEQEALLGANICNSKPDLEQQCPAPPSLGFYRIVLCNIRIIAGLLNTVMFSMILSGFDATLPLHLQRVFHWGTLPIGIIFLGLQVPGMALGPVVGWLRDRVGLRNPTTIGWILIAPLLWMLGIPGTGVDWADNEANGQVIFIIGVVGIGSVAPLVRGAGTFQLIAVTNDLQSKNASIFGPHGGSSRIFSITEIAFNIGTMLGPLFSGALVEAFDFLTMVGTLGQWYDIADVRQY
ncbi:Aldolase [Penicillium atrosanguineum]|uniref:Aldolase n=1 Tax=Penicillium atrosanguineum TaxID=1132637 RepID=UPI00239E2766|nr:Aldolase [Penicillium atrosanguineum]KAJ5309977.1 Aldolase [Penicillium atrosanguineum]